MLELWRAIPAWPSYAVSSLGRVKRVKACGQSPSGKILKQQPGPKGRYLYVQLSDGPRRRRYRAHILVLEVFVGPRPAGCQSRHLDGDNMNNRLSNLCWGTSAENGQDKAEHGSHKGSRHPKTNLTEEEVSVIRARYVPYSKHHGVGALAKDYGMSYGGMHKILTRESWGHVA